MAGSRIRGQKNQARPLVALDVGSANGFQNLEGKECRRPGLTSGRKTFIDGGFVEFRDTIAAATETLRSLQSLEARFVEAVNSRTMSAR
jgi:hypothetical protein